MVLKLELLPQVYLQLLVQCRGEQTGGLTGLPPWLLSSTDKGSVLLAPHMLDVSHSFGDSLSGQFLYLIVLQAVAVE